MRARSSWRARGRPTWPRTPRSRRRRRSRQSGDEEQAKLAALDTIADADEPVRLKSIDVGRREVTVVLVVHADTLVVGRIPFLDDLARVTVSGSTAAPRD